MSNPLESVIEALVIQYLNNLIDDVVFNASEAYTAGYVRASSVLGASITTDTLQNEVQAYIKKYRYKLVQQGIITVSSPLFNNQGQIIGFTDEDIEWMKDKPVKMKNELVDTIENGIKSGKAAGFKKLASGKYPENTIARDIQDVMTGYENDAATIARTETARCYFNGEKDRYAGSGVEYVQWMAAPDCCELCEPYRGQIMTLSECPSVPLHPNCRCDIRPILGSELEEYLKENMQ